MEISMGTNILEAGNAGQISPELLKILADGGVRAVDLHAGVHCDATSSSCKVIHRFIDYTNRAHIIRMKSWLKDLDLNPACMHAACCYPLDPAHIDEGIRKLTLSELKMCLIAAEELGIPVIVTHAGDKISQVGNREEGLAQLRKSIAELLPLARKSKVRVAVENVYAFEAVYNQDSLFGNLKGLVNFIKEINQENIGICLDTGHFNLIDGNKNIAEAVFEAGSKLYALHIHDNDGSSDQHLPPFCGSINWAGFAASLKQVGYTGTLNLEIRPPDSEKDLTAEFVQKIMGWARRLCD